MFYLPFLFPLSNFTTLICIDNQLFIITKILLSLGKSFTIRKEVYYH